MPKIQTDTLLRKQPHISIIYMLKAFEDKGLEFKHFRYELISPENLSSNEAKNVKEYLVKKNEHYRNEIIKGFFKKNKDPIRSLEKALNILKEHKVIINKNGRYFLTSWKYFDRIIAERDKKNIDIVQDKEYENLEVLPDFGIHIYGLNFDYAIKYCPNIKKDLESSLKKGCKKIAEGTKILNNINISVASQIKINNWKEVIYLLKKKNILLIDRQILLCFFIRSINDPLTAINNLYFWFETDSAGSWLEQKDWLKKCSFSSSGKIIHPQKKLSIQKPSKELINIISNFYPLFKEGEVYLKLKHHDINREISNMIISLCLLYWIQKRIGNLFIVSYPPTYEFFNIPLENGSHLYLSVSNELGLDETFENHNLQMIKNIKTYDGVDKLSDEILTSFSPIGNNIHSYIKDRLIRGAKESQWDKIFREILKKESKNFKPFSLILDAKTSDDLFRILKPKE